MTLEHGRNFIWDMEINSYDKILLSDMYIDTIIEIEKQYGSEDLWPFVSIRRKGERQWDALIRVQCRELDTELISNELTKIECHFEPLKEYNIGSDAEILLIFELVEDTDISNAFNTIQIYSDLVVNALNSVSLSKISRLANNEIASMLPIYQRAMSKVQLELSNYITDDSDNESKIVDICGRVKSLESIKEKLFRKGIDQYEALIKLDDIAGVRCTCEYLDDVYDVLEYIKNNPLLNVVDIDDKIKNSTKEGYRGIHIVVTTQIYFQQKLYEDIRVEIQLRTAFQNAWSMKTHELIYKQKTSLSDEMKEVMKKLSDVLKEADETALEMKKCSQNSMYN